MTQLTPKELTLENWKDEIGKYELISFVEALLALQKQSLKDKAVKRIEEEKSKHDHSPEMELARAIPMGVGTLKTYDQALSHAQDIIRNI